MGTSTIPAGGGGGLQPRYQKFTSSGTFTLPDGYGAAKPLLVNIQVIGGGGGGSANAFSTNAGGQIMGFGFNNYFGQNGNGAFATSGATTNNSIANLDGRGGGSGGIAATQMYLTGNLTITVGAAGAAANAVVGNGNRTLNSSDNSWFNSTNGNRPIDVTTNAGGTGGTTTAGSVSSAGGTGASLSNISISYTYTNGQFNGRDSNATVTVNAINAVTNVNAGTNGSGGTPSGTAGAATPLLGTLAGGSTNTNPVFGSFGVGGKRGDATTNTGVEGTGGGAGAVGAPGAVILTWWQ